MPGPIWKNWPAACEPPGFKELMPSFARFLVMSDAAEKDLNKEQLRALALVFQEQSGGAEGFARSLVKARKLAGRSLHGDALWRRISEEISVMETSLALNRTLSR